VCGRDLVKVGCGLGYTGNPDATRMACLGLFTLESKIGFVMYIIVLLYMLYYLTLICGITVYTLGCL
jgi:hypothetical protein